MKASEIWRNYMTAMDKRRPGSALSWEHFRSYKAAAEAEKIKAAKKAEKQALIGKSPLRTWIAEKFGNPYWNGKVYEGNAKYNRPSRVYLDNKEVEIPADVYAAQVEWRKRRDEINAKEAANGKN